MKILKRSGAEVEYDESKIWDIAYKVLLDENVRPSEHLSRADDILKEVQFLMGEPEVIQTEKINDYVEEAFMHLGMLAEFRSFVLHREKNKTIRSMSADNSSMSDYIFKGRYAQYIKGLDRRETWDEAVDRVRDMHIRKYPHMAKEIIWAFERVREKRVLPSMRSMQFGGPAIESNHARMYNCSYSVADRMEFFSETIYLLLCGCGVGFSVEWDNIHKLPELMTPDMTVIKTHQIEDSIEGWADSIKELMNSYQYGYTIEFDYSLIRVQGSPITSGGKAPGHVPLRRSIEKIRTVLDGAVDRKLKPIEAYDIVMHSADAVLAGGVRRSACICMFSKDDDEMINAKTGDWLEANPQRARSNNSVKLIRKDTSREEFQRIFERQKTNGEPAFYFVDDLDHGSNPCVEIGLLPFLEGKTGFAFCNLTTINGKKLESEEDFKIAVKASVIIGTCQAGYTDFKYVSKTTKEIADHEALLGLSITGIMDQPRITLNEGIQQRMAKYAIEENKRVSKLIGINEASRITCVKPEGSTSILLDTASGIHPRYADKYFRRIQANVNDPIYKHFKAKNPHCCEPSVYSTNKTDDVITFCCRAPKGAICKDDLSALEFLKMIKNTQQNWVIPGTAHPERAPGLNHNVSNTIPVKDHEWDEVADYIYENRAMFTGISMIPDGNGMVYDQSPFQQVADKDDELMWNGYVSKCQDVDYVTLKELEDNTTLKDVVACGGNNCEIT